MCHADLPSSFTPCQATPSTTSPPDALGLQTPAAPRQMDAPPVGYTAPAFVTPGPAFLGPQAGTQKLAARTSAGGGLPTGAARGGSSEVGDISGLGLGLGRKTAHGLPPRAALG